MRISLAMFRGMSFIVSLVSWVTVMATIGGCGGSSKTGNITAQGGTVVSSDSKFVLIVPPNAVLANTPITVNKLDNVTMPPSLKAYANLGYDYQLQPPGLIFRVTATGRLTLDQADAADFLEDTGVSNVVLMSEEGSQPLLLANSITSIDQETGDYLSASDVDHFSYAISSEGIAHVIVRPGGVAGSVGMPSTIGVHLAGETNVAFGNAGEVNQVLIKSALLSATGPDFVSIDPTEVDIDYTTDGAATIDQTFNVTCGAGGVGTLYFLLDAPQTYSIATASSVTPYTNDTSFGTAVPVICADASASDADTHVQAAVAGDPGTATVGDDAIFDLDLLVFNAHGSAIVTGVVADDNIAGISPQSIDPYPSESYRRQAGEMSFTCFEAGTTSVSFQFVVEDVSYRDGNGNVATKTVTLDLDVPLTCTN